jgi:hypothetical protein
MPPQLYGVSAVFGREGVVMLAELAAGDGDRAALLSTVKQRGTALVLGHAENCC